MGQPRRRGDVEPTVTGSILAHVMHMGAWGWFTWLLFWGFLVLLAVGIVLAARGRGEGDGSARRILDERLARGEISPEEHRERAAILGPQKRGGPARGVALGLLVLGLVGTLVAAAAGPGSGGGFMHGMMGGGMGGMMGGGETGRSASPPAPGARELTVSGGEFFFEPDEIQAEAGEPVNITFDNRGMMFHTLTIGELGFELRAEAGESASGGLTVDEPGTYSFICAVPGHAEAGMRGTLTVA